MPNRFAGRIRRGEIESVEALKTEFKALAKETHPDLRGSAGAEDFIKVRDEYESALRDFERHRFGFRPSSGGSSGAGGGGGRAGPSTLFAILALLRKRGFPKRPRHEKEALRYEYALWRFLRALGDGDAEAASDLSAAFPAFEASLLALKDGGDPRLKEALGLLDELVEFARRRLPAMRTALVVGLGRFKADPRTEAELSRFLELLAAELGIGAALGSAG